MNLKIPNNVFCCVCAMFFAAFILSGCIFFPEPYKPVRIYDLETPENIAPENMIIDIQSFVNESPARRRFFYRMNKFEVENDDYNRWAQAPGLMMNRYLQISFSKQDIPGQNVSRYTVSGGITTFEIDFDSNQATLAVEYNIRSLEDLKQTFKNFGVFTEKTEKQCPAAFAKAMTKAAEKFAQALKREIIEFDKLQKILNQENALEDGKKKKE